MTQEKNRKAYFHCSLIYLDPNDTSNPVLIETQWHGIICSEKSGDKGFGYDPIFFIPELDKTSAELSVLEKNKNVDVVVENYNIIYELIDSVEERILKSQVVEETLIKQGAADIKAVFDFDNKPVAGILINEGKVNSNNRLKIYRNGKEIFFGKIKSLKHYKSRKQAINVDR